MTYVRGWISGDWVPRKIAIVVAVILIICSQGLAIAIAKSIYLKNWPEVADLGMNLVIALLMFIWFYSVHTKNQKE